MVYKSQTLSEKAHLTCIPCVCLGESNPYRAIHSSLFLYSDSKNDHSGLTCRCPHVFNTNHIGLVRMNQAKKTTGVLRNDIRRGDTVDIVMKKDQRTNRLTRGIVKEILTNSPSHPHGIKVRLQTGEVGRVQTIIKSHN